MEKKKHQRKAISLEMKIAILDRLAKGEGSTAIGKNYNLGESTIRAIKNNEVAIRKSVVSGTKLSAKLSSYARDAVLEKTERALVIWIEDLTQKQIPISGYLIKQKALQFYEEMKKKHPSTKAAKTDKVFSASKGWLTRFLKRNAIHNMKIKGEVVSADDGASKIFPENLAKIIEEVGYCPDQVFNASETGLYWKKMPNRTYIAKSKSNLDMVEYLENESETEEKELSANKIQEGLQLCNKLENHFLANDPSSERAKKFQRELKNCMAVYRKLYKKIVKSSSQSMSNESSQIEVEMDANSVCEQLLYVPCRSDPLTLSSSDESNFAPVSKSYRSMSDSDDNSGEKM